MVKPGATDTRDLSNDLATLRHAQSIVQDVMDGKRIRPEMIDQARETFIEMIWNGQPTTESASRRGLLILYAKSPDPSDKAELIGELFAAGKRGQSILEEILRVDSSTKLTADELQALRNSMHLPLQDRLKLVLRLMSEEMAVQGRTDGSNLPDNDLPFGSDKAILPPRLDTLKDEEITDSAGGPPDDLETLTQTKEGAKAILMDPGRSFEVRHKAAMALGREAVPFLGQQLLNENATQREFAVAALINLGKTRDAARTVHETMQRYETVLDTRRAAEFVQKTMESEIRGENYDPLARERAKSAGIADGWLRRSMADCDSPNILKAAAGREAIAIPMGIRLLHEMRTARAKPMFS